MGSGRSYHAIYSIFPLSYEFVPCKCGWYNFIGLEVIYIKLIRGWSHDHFLTIFKPQVALQVNTGSLCILRLSYGTLNFFD